MGQDSSHREYLSNAPVAVLAGGIVGAVIALFALMIGAIRIGIALLFGTRITFEGYDLILYYVLGFVIGGMLAGLLWPIRRRVGGYYGLGIALMSAAIAAITLAEEGPLATWDTFTWIMVIALSILFGLALGHGAKSVGS